MIPFWLAIPFVAFLLSIAILPLTVPRFWEKNSRKAAVALFFSLPVALWFFYHEPHHISHSLFEYFSFIVLLGSLFVISGGISVTGDLRATPFVNTAYLAIGAVLANFIGTTGASMVLIRSFLKTNSERKNIKHLPIFFIFVVSNCGGLLTPLGDPPLFLGYLRGVPFFWTLRLFPYWGLMVGILLLVFFVWDSLAYNRETAKSIEMDESSIKPLKITGRINFLFLAGVLLGVFFRSPLREAIMIGMAVLSLTLGPKGARHENRFSWHPIVEVAILFAGIFITMVPALLLLKEHAPSFGITKPVQFFWLTGALSGFLDNAPTYITFLSLAQGAGLGSGIVGIPVKILEAISIGAVFMGANTYIGNGPNFMVKAIADHAGFKTPSFFGYMFYSVMILFPLYLIISIMLL